MKKEDIINELHQLKKHLDCIIDSINENEEQT